jgi:hypothetical protein
MRELIHMPDEREKRALFKMSDRVMNLISMVIFYMIMILFIFIAIVLIGLAFDRLWITVTAFPRVSLDVLFEAIGFTTVGVAVVELARTMYEEEIQSPIQMTAPLKIRHFLSRFLTVIIISLAIEFLTMVFRFSHKPDEFIYLYEAAAVALGASLLFIAWALYNWTSVAVEKHEHETVQSQLRK